MEALQPGQAWVPPPPDLQLHLIGDHDGDYDHCCRAGSRRPSNVSLSRIRSCPQLAVLTNSDRDSPFSDMAPITDEQGNIIHLCPALRHHLYVDTAEPDNGGIRSAASTPTPPSTPGSRRNYVIVSSCISKSRTYGSGAVPALMPGLQIQPNTNSVLGSKNHSIDIPGEHLDGWAPLGNEHLQLCDQCSARNSASSMHFPVGDYSEQFLDDEKASPADDHSSAHFSGRFPSQAGRHRCHNYFLGASGDDSIDKCHRWLQSLNINTADKMKSRSHIQLSSA